MDILRKLVSGKRRRLCQDKYDLDITFITPKIAGMSFPASGIEKWYRNNINDVRRSASNFVGCCFLGRKSHR